MLHAYLDENNIKRFNIARNKNDPPDLLISFEDGKSWGVEVTRLYQAALKFEAGDHPRRCHIANTEEIFHNLEELALEIKEQTESVRERGYTIFLEGRGAFSSYKRPVNWKNHRRAIKAGVISHIHSGSDAKLRFEGGTLFPGEPGLRWTISVGNPIAEVDKTFVYDLTELATAKINNIHRWTPNLNEKWLLVFDCHGLADIESTKRNMPAIFKKNSDLCCLNGIFWAPFYNRKLVKFANTFWKVK